MQKTCRLNRRHNTNKINGLSDTPVHYYNSEEETDRFFEAIGRRL